MLRCTPFRKRWSLYSGIHSVVRFYAVPPSQALNSVPPTKTRNIGIIAHIDAGKTTTTERMLFYSGRTARIGNVDEGDTVTDYLTAERERGITIQLAAITLPWNGHKINVLDTPGHADFTMEVIRSLRVLDGAVTILDGVAGVETQTEKVWKQASALGIPRIAFINKMDREGAGFSRTVKEIVLKLQTRVVLCNIPYFALIEGEEEPKFCGVVDVIHKKILKWSEKLDSSGKEIELVDLESNGELYPDIYEMVLKTRESMVETLGEFDETVIESFFDNDADYMKVPVNVLINSIKSLTLTNQVTPVFCGASFRNIGVQPLMDGVVSYLPSPLEVSLPEVTTSSGGLYKLSKKNKKKNIKVSAADTNGSSKSTNAQVLVKLDPKKGVVVNNNSNLTLALAFKVITHETRGVMTFFRVYSGRINANSMILNTRSGSKIPINKLYMMHGDQPEPVKFIGLGNIGVILGTDNSIITGDTLVGHSTESKHFGPTESALKLLPIPIPAPLFNAAIEPLTAGDERYMNECIAQLMREDPSLKVQVDNELGQTILGGMGELHLDIVQDRLVRDMKAKVRLRDVVVSYMETATKTKPLLGAHLEENEDSSISVSISLESFEGRAEDSMFAEEEGAYILPDNNVLVFEPTATPTSMHSAISDRRWKSAHTLEQLQESIVQGCLIGLQQGGPLYGFPFHSMVIRIKLWTFPVDTSEGGLSVLLDISRRSVRTSVSKISEGEFCLLEPIMNVRVHVPSNYMGETVHDLSHRCNATITSIEDDATDLDNTWATELAQTIYVPPDFTMKSAIDGANRGGNKIIHAEVPLKEMIGYLSKLRKLTLGQGTFDMDLGGMRRMNKDRMNLVIG